MRFLLLTAFAALATASAAAPVTTGQPIRPLKGPAIEKCARTTSQYAEKGVHRGQRVAPKKLNELPPAVGYMAVYRTVNGCEVPMTVTEYRTGRRP